MDPSLILLVVFGAVGGLIAGLVGVGGGIIFAPVLFFYFQSIGIAPTVIAPLTIGSSLLCTLTASCMSAYQHHKKGVVIWPVALRVGAYSAVALNLLILFVTTKPFFDRTVFQFVFGALLLVVAVRMLFSPRIEEKASGADGPSVSEMRLAGIGSGAGLVAAAAGVGGGVVMVPAFRHLLGFQIHRAVGTSSGAIILISALGVMTYSLNVPDETAIGFAVGHVAVAHALLLAVPAIFGARAGARLAHRIDRRRLQVAFAVFAAAVAVRMLYAAMAG